MMGTPARVPTVGGPDRVRGTTAVTAATAVTATTALAEPARVAGMRPVRAGGTTGWRAGTTGAMVRPATRRKIDMAGPISTAGAIRAGRPTRTREQCRRASRTRTPPTRNTAAAVMATAGTTPRRTPSAARITMVSRRGIGMTGATRTGGTAATVPSLGTVGSRFTAASLITASPDS